MIRHNSKRIPAAAGLPSRAPGVIKAVAVVAVLGLAAPAFAATSGGDPMPWEGPMQRMLDFFTGPFVRIAAVIAIVLLGIGMAFSENGSGMRKLTTAFFGLALAFGAATWGLSFFGFSGGASINGVYVEPAAATTAEAFGQEASPVSQQGDQPAVPATVAE